MKLILCFICLIVFPCKSYANEITDIANGVPIKHYPEIYKGDWSKLPTGKFVPKLKINDKDVIDISGDSFRREYLKKDEVSIKHIRAGVRWQNPYHKYNNALILIRNCKRVIVDDIYIKQMDADYRASSSIFIEDCDQVVVKNSYFAGTTNSYHIRIEGCENVIIDNIEIEGLQYSEKGVRCGGGIFINNGDPKMGGIKGMLSPSPKNLKWCVIQNSYIHNNLSADEWRNQDGILIHSASDGLLFNCYFEKWKEGDAALDISHRRSDETYRNHFFRVERNIFDNCSKAKTPGTSHSSNTIFFVNNIYTNTFFGDYHSGWDVYHVHETFVYNKNYAFSVFYSIWALDNGASHLKNTLVVSTGRALQYLFYQGKGASPQNYQLIKPDHMVYVMPNPEFWIGGLQVNIKKWSEWQSSFKDKNSSFINTGQEIFRDVEQKDYRLCSGSPVVSSGSDYYLKNIPKVLHDFTGKLRPAKPSVGAFEVYSKELYPNPLAPEGVHVISD